MTVFRSIPAPAPLSGGRDHMAQAADDRMPRFLGLEVDASAALWSLSVLVVGAGSVGSEVAEHFARLGVGRVAVVDPKRFKANLGTQPILPGDEMRATVLIETHPIPFARRAPLYRDGAKIITPSVPRVPPRFVSPRAKTHNYLNLILGDLEAQASDPDAWAVLLDESGNLTEGRGSNIFLVKDGTVATPKGQYVLEGITRGVTMNLATGLNMPVEERDLDLYDAYTADEAFLTSTSLCICPISSVNGTPVAGGKAPGVITRRLMDAFSDLAGMDFEGQYLAHLE